MILDDSKEIGLNIRSMKKWSVRKITDNYFQLL